MSVETAHEPPDAQPPKPAARDAARVSTSPSTGRSLKRRAIVGTAWTMSDYMLGRLLALAANVALSYFIAPDAFGLMTVVNVLLMGLQMFSDIGIGPNIIFSKRGDHPDFLNTAFTIQAIRGAALFGLSCLAAWPMSIIYNEPLLVVLLPVCGFTSVIQGFTSTSLVSLNRRMQLRLITTLAIVGHVLQILTMLAWAIWITRDVWALVFGSYVSSLFRVAYSHALQGYERYDGRTWRNRFTWNADDARSMFRFGRWIFLSTMLTFFAGQLDKMLIARFLGMATTGIYNNAWQFAMVPQQLLKKVGAMVVFPVLAEVARERPGEMQRQFKRVRYPLVLVSLAGILALMLLAKPLINLLYRGPYQQAGPMLQVLAVGVMGGLLNSTYGSALLALGKTFVIMVLLAAQIAILVTATTLGYRMHGEIGFIWGVALVEWLNYPLTAYMLHRYGLFQPLIDALALGVCAGAVVLVFVVFP